MSDQTPACRGEDTELFYNADGWARAAALCRKCPLAVKLQCRQDFADDGWAFAGGMTPAQRQAWVHRERERGRKRPPEARTPDGPRSTRGRLTEAEKAEIVRMFDAELIGTKAIADRLGYSKSAVQRTLRLAGRRRTPEEELELSRRGGLAGGQMERGRQNTEMVVQLLAAGHSPKQVASMTGLTYSNVYVHRRKRIMEMFEQGYPAEVVAKAVGSTEKRVLKTKEQCS